MSAKATPWALVLQLLLIGCRTSRQPAASERTEYPAREWARSTPDKVGLDEKVLTALDADFRSSKYPLMDSSAVFRCGKESSHDNTTMRSQLRENI